jgi:hypothetical protein
MKQHSPGLSIAKLHDPETKSPRFWRGLSLLLELLERASGSSDC